MDRRSEIEKLAYELFEKSGCKHGQADEHWFQAEIMINARYTNSAAEEMPKTKKIVAKPVSADAPAKKAKGKSASAAKAPAKTQSKAKKSKTSQKEASL